MPQWLRRCLSYMFYACRMFGVPTCMESEGVSASRRSRSGAISCVMYQMHGSVFYLKGEWNVLIAGRRGIIVVWCEVQTNIIVVGYNSYLLPMLWWMVVLAVATCVAHAMMGASVVLSPAVFAGRATILAGGWIDSPLKRSKVVPVNFNTAYTVIPQAYAGIINFSFDPFNYAKNIQVYASNVYLTGMNINVSTQLGQIVMTSVSYIVIDNQKVGAAFVISSITNFPSGTYNIFVSTTQMKFLHFIRGYTSNNYDSNITAITSMEPTDILIFRTIMNSIDATFKMTLVKLNLSVLSPLYQPQIDYFNPSPSSVPSLPNFSLGGFFYAINSFSIINTALTSSSPISNILLRDNGTINVISGNISFLNVTYFRLLEYQCPDPTYPKLYNSNCYDICPDATYFNITYSPILCLPCLYKCLTCNNSLNCTSCDISKNRKNDANHTCDCQDKFWDTGASSCSPCLPSCLTCNNATSCITCDTNLNLNATPNNYNCVCKNASFGLVAGPLISCTLCKDSIQWCQTCSTLSSCNTCLATNYTKASPVKCTCASTLYTVSNDFCVLCKDLILGCKNCSSTTNCTLCDSARYFIQDGQGCKCPDATYLSGTLFESKSCLNCDPTCLTCTVSATNCTSCNNITLFRTQSGTSCVCISSYYESNGLCNKCLDSCLTCVNSSNQCTSCNAALNRFLRGSTCACSQGHFENSSFECQSCSSSCLNCTATSNNCTSCRINQFRDLVSFNSISTCTCITGYYETGDDICGQCPPNCVSCISYTNCTSCNPNKNYTLKIYSGTSKNCLCLGNFVQRSSHDCVLCVDLIHGCSECSNEYACRTCIVPNYTLDSNSKCQCLTQDKYLPFNQICVFCRDIIWGCVDCSDNSTCITCDKTAFFQNSGSKCKCIDGRYMEATTTCELCDVSCITCVGNKNHCLSCNATAMRTLVGSDCKCMEPYQDCRFSNLIGCDPRDCMYLATPQLTISSMVKDPDSNSIEFKISMSPLSPDFDNFDFNQLFSLGLPLSTQISYSYQDGIITGQANYMQNLQDLPCNISLNLNSAALPWYFSLVPACSMSYTVTPTNNLASNYYSPEIYKMKSSLDTIVYVAVGVSMLVYLLGLISSKVVSSEMMAVNQLSYFGLFIVNHSDPLVEPLSLFRYTNGINSMLNSAQGKTPNRVYALDFAPSVSSNLNYMLLLIVVPPIASLIFHIIHKRSIKWRIRMERAFKLALGECLMTMTLFTLYNYSSSLAVFMTSAVASSWQFYMSIVELVLYGGVGSLMVWFFVKKDDSWMGEYKWNFNWNRFCELYYLVPLGQRFLIGFLLGAINMTFAAGIICSLLMVSSIVVVAVKKPFIEKYHNARSIATSAMGVLLLGVYITLGVSGPSKGQSLLTFFPFFVVGIVGVNSAMALGFIVLEFVKQGHRNVKEEIENKEKDQEDMMNMDMQNKIKQIMEQNRKNAIKTKLINNKVEGHYNEPRDNRHAVTGTLHQ